MRIKSLKLKIKNYSLKLKVFRFAVLIVTFNFALLTFSLRAAHAASFSLGIYPPILEIIAKPGAQVLFPIKIYNTGDDLDLKLTLESFTAADEAGHPKILPTAPKPYLPWVKLQSGALVLPSEEPFTLKAGQDQEFKLKIDIPKDASQDDYYFLTLWQSQAGGEVKETTAQTAGQVGLPVLLTVSSLDQYPLKGEVREFSTPEFLESGPVPFTVRVENTGKFHFAPTGKIEIKNMLGQKVDEVEILPQNVLSGTIRALVDTSQATPSSIFNFQFSIFNSPKVIWSSHFLLGKYTANLSLSLSDWGPELFTQTTFWVFPVKWAMGILAGILFLLLIWRKIKGAATRTT